MDGLYNHPGQLPGEREREEEEAAARGELSTLALGALPLQASRLTQAPKPPTFPGRWGEASAGRSLEFYYTDMKLFL